ncbi:MAG: MBL fold metallo-hydrolase [bacterium]|nr:MBL fold metallo-hydrolase [bacterium]
MKIVWFGHATFFAELDNKIRIIFDPYDKSAYGSSFTYSDNFPKCDIALISHSHRDHSFRNFKEKFGYQPIIMDSEGEREEFGVKITGRKFFHDKAEGRERGEVIVFSVKENQKEIIHFSDIGESVKKEKFQEMKNPYIAMVPVGGRYTIDGEEAAELVGILSPRFVFPMHYKTSRLDFPIESEERFLKSMNNYEIQRADSFNDNEENVKKTIFIFNPADKEIQEGQ